MADPFVAEIRIFAFNFAPKGWAWCDGQLLPLSQNTASVELLTPEESVAPGQGCVFYDRTRVLGGGWIARAEVRKVAAE